MWTLTIPHPAAARSLFRLVDPVRQRTAGGELHNQVQVRLVGEMRVVLDPERPRRCDKT